MTVCICQNSQNCKLKEGNSIARKLCFNKPHFNFFKILKDFFKKLFAGEKYSKNQSQVKKKKKSCKKEAQLLKSG